MLKKNWLSAYMENTLNGEKSSKGGLLFLHIQYLNVNGLRANRYE
jgi:hypothetical protein